MSQNVEHLVPEGCYVVLHRKVKDPDIFEREALPNALVEGRGDRAVGMGLPASLASQTWGLRAGWTTHSGKYSAFKKLFTSEGGSGSCITGRPSYRSEATSKAP